MLIASNDFHQPLPVIKRLILRLAGEEKLTYTRLKINRFLPTHLYTALISANLNLAYLKEVEGMNGHLFRVDHNKTVFKRAFCTYCKQRIVDVAECGRRLLLFAFYDFSRLQKAVDNAYAKNTWQ